MPGASVTVIQGIWQEISMNLKKLNMSITDNP